MQLNILWICLLKLQNHNCVGSFLTHTHIHTHTYIYIYKEMIYPAVSYFVVYKKGCQDTASSIHKALHEAGTEVEVKELRTEKKSQGKEKELLSKLCQVLKDHNSTYALGRLKDSVDFCYEQAISDNLEGADDAEKRRLFPFLTPHVDDTSLKELKVPTRLCVTDMEEYGIEIAAAISNLSRDGLQCTFQDNSMLQPLSELDIDITLGNPAMSLFKLSKKLRQ